MRATQDGKMVVPTAAAGEPIPSFRFMVVPVPTTAPWILFAIDENTGWVLYHHLVEKIAPLAAGAPVSQDTCHQLSSVVATELHRLVAYGLLKRDPFLDWQFSLPDYEVTAPHQLWIQFGRGAGYF